MPLKRDPMSGSWVGNVQLPPNRYCFQVCLHVLVRACLCIFVRVYTCVCVIVCACVDDLMSVA